ncbi:MAG: Gfo/Idh/MocA family oxidoreductase [Pseudomonadales bacterium]
MNEVRFGLVGAGAIAELTARDLARHDAVRLTAVADPSTQRAAALAAQFDIPYTHADAAALLRRDDIDAVYVAVPNALHAGLATAALAAGKHVLLEKPFATSAAEAEAVAAAAERHGRLLMLGMNQRFDANVQRARQLVRSGELGPVYFARGYWRRRSGIPRIGSWFTRRADAGGGALLDIGVHILDVLLFVLDEFKPVSVSGVAFSRQGNRGRGDGDWGRSERDDSTFDVDDLAAALVRLDSGAALSLEAAWALHQPDQDQMGAELHGEDAGLSVYRNQLYRPGDGGGYSIVEGLPDGPLPYPHCSRSHHFVNVLLDREPAVVTVSQALTVQRLLDAIYASAAAGREVAL